MGEGRHLFSELKLKPSMALDPKPIPWPQMSVSNSNRGWAAGVSHSGLLGRALAHMPLRAGTWPDTVERIAPVATRRIGTSIRLEANAGMIKMKGLKGHAAQRFLSSAV